jgi:hypothetical protein
MLHCTKGAIIRKAIGGMALKLMLLFVRCTIAVRPLKGIDPKAKSER